MVRFAFTVTLLVVGLSAAPYADASVVIAATRVIYSAGQSEVTVKLTNEGLAPALTQTWLDDGDPKAAPGAISIPFIVMPPVARIDPGSGQTLRIFHTGEPLPEGRESIFWLNVLEIPPKASGTANKLELAFRSRIKFFYRPAGLLGTALEAPSKVQWQLMAGGAQVRVYNPTPYFVSYSSFEIARTSGTSKFDDGGMVGPGEFKSFPLDHPVAAAPDLTVRYHAISDLGGAVDGTAPLLATP
jgi:fimbrial chaperone protein/chaperone protein EcpD